MIPTRWGFCMAGNEETFCKMLDLAIDSDGPFIYYEIGIGHGDTMLAVDEYLADIPRKLVGIDVPAWKTDREFPETITMMTVGSEVFLSNVTQLANFVFIDGCHGSPCVKRDFLLAEKVVKKGGIIAFHDADPNSQGRHFQDHCKMGIDVRNALGELGLLDDQRPGWWKVAETWGDQYKGGHGCVFIQRT